MPTARRSLSFLVFLLAFVTLTHGQTPLRLRPVAPCRLVDTRPLDNNNGFQGTMNFNLQQAAMNGGNAGQCTPFSLTSAQAYSLNVTLVPAHGRPVNYLTLWPTGEPQPLVSLMNSYDGRIKANAAIVPAGSPNGEVSIYLTDNADILIDIDGYFDSASDNMALAFFPLTPCRLVDTRGGHDGGTLQAMTERDYLIPGTCGIPSNASAYSFNVTAIPAGSLFYLTVWPQGETQPVVSTLNDQTGTVVANAAIVPAGPNNKTAFWAYNNTDLLVDTNGYFAPANSASNPLSLFTLAPCRVLDTRSGLGLFNGTIPVGVVGSSCGIPASSSEAFVFNATVVPGNPPAGFLTLWPEGETQPTVSTLNAYDGAVTSNMAIVPAGSGNDSINAFADNSAGGTTDLILDISSYFAPIAAITIQNSSPLPNGTLNMGYSVPLVATGGVAPYTWTKISGNLPPGLSLSSAGTISGTATATGNFNFEVQATDSNSPAGTSTANLSITVNSSAGTPTILTTSLPSATGNTPYNTLLNASGGVTPYTWSVLSGGLPGGLSLNAGSGLISGIPLATGLANLVVQVKDSLGNTNNQQFVIVVNSGGANGTVNGMYAGSFTGWDNGNFFVSAFSITADGNGNLTAGEFDYNSPVLGHVSATLTSGNYTMGSNGLGQINWTDSTGASVQVLVSTATAERMHIIGYNQNGNSRWGSGALRQQNPSDFSEAALAGSWAFGYQGFDPSAHPISGDGAFTATTNGNIAGVEDINDYGTHSQPTFTGNATSNLDSNGRFTVQYDVQGIGTIHLAAYTVSRNETIAIEIDSGGGLYVINSLRQSGGSFGLGSFNGSAVGGGSRIHNGDQNQALAVLAASSGNGNISFTEDLNSGGSFTTGQLDGTYTVASNGRLDATLSDSSQIVCYFVVTDEAFCINAVPAPGSNDHGAEVIFLEPQVGTGQFSAASFSGEYLGGSLPQYYLASGTYTQIDSNVASGANTFASTYSQCGITGCPNLSQSISGTYNVNASTGAITISQGGNPVYAGFMVSTNEVVYVTAAPGSVPLTLIELASSAP